MVTKLSNIWVWDPIPDPESRGQKGTGSRILVRNTEDKVVPSHFFVLKEPFRSRDLRFHPPQSNWPLTDLALGVVDLDGGGGKRLPLLRARPVSCLQHVPGLQVPEQKKTVLLILTNWLRTKCVTIRWSTHQCCRSVTFWYGSADPCLWIMDPDPALDPAIFVFDHLDANRKLFFLLIIS